MYRTMLDLIKPKLVYLDLPLFMALLSDLFPGVEQPPTPAGDLRLAIEADLVENNLQVMPAGAICRIASLCLQRPGNCCIAAADQTHIWFLPVYQTCLDTAPCVALSGRMIHESA